MKPTKSEGLFEDWEDLFEDMPEDDVKELVAEIEMEEAKQEEVEQKLQAAVNKKLAEQHYRLASNFSRGLNGFPQDQEQAFNNFKSAADLGHVWAQYSTGSRYEEGDGVAINYTEALRYYELFVRQQDQRGQSVLKNLREKIARYTELNKCIEMADQGNADYQFQLGVLYETGKDVRKNSLTALEWYEAAAKQDHQEAKEGEARLREKERLREQNLREEKLRVEKPREEKLREEERLKEEKIKLQGDADKGDVNAQYDLGLSLAKTEVTESFRYFKMAADSGHMKARYHTAVRYANGTGVGMNLPEAFKYHKMAADQGYTAAQYQVGYCYQKGLLGVKKNPSEAQRYYQLAADQGHYTAKSALNFLIKKEQKFQTVVISELRRKADDGDLDAQRDLALRYSRGDRVESNIKEACRYCLMAIKQGHVKSVNLFVSLIDRIEKNDQEAAIDENGNNWAFNKDQILEIIGTKAFEGMIKSIKSDFGKLVLVSKNVLSSEDLQEIRQSFVRVVQSGGVKDINRSKSIKMIDEIVRSKSVDSVAPANSAIAVTAHNVVGIKRSADQMEK